MPSDLVNLTEAAEILRLKPCTVRAWVLRRRIPYVKLGRRVLFRRRDLEALISENVVPAHADAAIGARP
jgi:excisionase family DNA binding protein